MESVRQEVVSKSLDWKGYVYVCVGPDGRSAPLRTAQVKACIVCAVHARSSHNHLPRLFVTISMVGKKYAINTTCFMVLPRSVGGGDAPGLGETEASLVKSSGWWGGT